MALFKVVFTDPYGPDTTLEEDEIRRAGLGFTALRLAVHRPEDWPPEALDADALLVAGAPVTRQVIERLTRCRVISRYGTGVDMIDVAAAREHGIPVCNAPNGCLPEMAAHTLSLLLNLNRGIACQDRHVRQGGWYPPPMAAPGRLQGQTHGIIGFGRIGQSVARLTSAVGLTVIAYDPYPNVEAARALGIQLVPLARLLQDADYVSIHCPITAETRHLIGREQLGLMKPTAYLINVSRGAIVDQAALYQALAGKAIAGAALDVLEQEPPAISDPLLRLDNVILTTHTAFWSQGSLADIRRETARNVAEVLLGRPAPNVVRG